MKTYTEPPLTVADLEGAPDDGNRYEVIEGELHISSAPSYFHQMIVMRLTAAFLEFLKAQPIGEVVAGVGVIFDEFSGVIPDLVFLTYERKRQILLGGRLNGAPEIVVEVLSPGNANDKRDRHLKRSLYSSHGVHEYWIANPEARTIEVHRKQREGGLVQAVTLQSGDVLTSPLLPEFRVDIDTLFA